MSSPITFDCRPEEWESKHERSRELLSRQELKIVECVFKKGVDCYASGHGGGRWTLEIRDALADLGEKNYKLLPFPNKFAGKWEKGGEWLFDLCWVDAPSG